MEGTYVEYFPNIDNIRLNQSKYEFNLYIRDYNKEYSCDSYAHMVHLFKKFI